MSKTKKKVCRLGLKRVDLEVRGPEGGIIGRLSIGPETFTWVASQSDPQAQRQPNLKRDSVLRIMGTPQYEGKRKDYFDVIRDGMTYGQYKDENPGDEAKGYISFYVKKGFITTQAPCTKSLADLLKWMESSSEPPRSQIK